MALSGRTAAAGVVFVRAESAVSVRYVSLPESKRWGCESGPCEQGVAFYDAVTVMRRWLWAEGVFRHSEGCTALVPLPRKLH